MRVIGGRLGGRRFYPPLLAGTRPTTSFAKTALFNILSHRWHFDGLHVLDLFSGTGAISLEFLSRGCQAVTAVEHDEKCVRYLERLKREWNLNNWYILRDDVAHFLAFAEGPYHIIFAGPPYDYVALTELPDQIFDRQLLTNHGWFILETYSQMKFEHHPMWFQTRKYGQTHFHFFAAIAPGRSTDT